MCSHFIEITFFTAAMFTSAINYLAGAASSVAGGSVPPAPSIPGDPSGISQDDPLVKKYLNHLSSRISHSIMKVQVICIVVSHSDS